MRRAGTEKRMGQLIIILLDNLVHEREPPNKGQKPMTTDIIVQDVVISPPDQLPFRVFQMDEIEVDGVRTQRGHGYGQYFFSIKPESWEFFIDQMEMHHDCTIDVDEWVCTGVTQHSKCQRFVTD